jgi:hypothetical protein
MLILVCTVALLVFGSVAFRMDVPAAKIWVLCLLFMACGLLIALCLNSFSIVVCLLFFFFGL